jgi:hypothetical protein
MDKEENIMEWGKERNGMDYYDFFFLSLTLLPPSYHHHDHSKMEKNEE